MLGIGRNVCMLLSFLSKGDTMRHLKLKEKKKIRCQTFLFKTTSKPKIQRCQCQFVFGDGLGDIYKYREKYFKKKY
jgi:hypothetical protein